AERECRVGRQGSSVGRKQRLADLLAVGGNYGIESVGSRQLLATERIDCPRQNDHRIRRGSDGRRAALQQLLPNGWITDASATHQRRGSRLGGLSGERDAQERIARRQLGLRRAELRGNRQTLEGGVDWCRRQQLVTNVGQARAAVLRQPRRVWRVRESSDANEAGRELEQRRSAAKPIVPELRIERGQLSLRAGDCIESSAVLRLQSRIRGDARSQLLLE